jgi:hypothetical protein
MALYLLWMDHRDSFATRVYRVRGDPNPAEAKHIVDGKDLIYRGLLDALDRGVSSASC